MAAPGAPIADASRRPRLAGLVSIAVHGGVLIAVMLLVGDHVTREAPTIELTPIQVVDTHHEVIAQPGTPTVSPTKERAGTRGRQGRDAPPRSLSRAPIAAQPVVADPFADVVVSYEARPGPDPGSRADAPGTGLGTGLLGDGTGSAGNGPFGVGSVPPAPGPSLARPPRPKANYRNWNFRADPRFAGATVQVELTIDPKGGVREVQLLEGVTDDIDQRAVALARRFEFHPALDDAGVPTWGRHRWEFVLLGSSTIQGGLPMRR